MTGRKSLPSPGEKGKAPARLLPGLRLNQDALPSTVFLLLLPGWVGFFLLYLQLIHTVNSPDEKIHPSLAVGTLHPSFHCVSTSWRSLGSLVQDAGWLTPSLPSPS